MRPLVAALAAVLLPLPALGQQVIVRTDPPRATLVCDGRVVGITPVAFDPTSVRTCTLFARGHANLTVDPSALTGVIASYRLEAVTPTADVPCGALDPRTGLFRVCLDQPTPRRRAARGTCGHLDPETGLMVVCFAPPERSRGVTPAAGHRCGQLDPRTGLMIVCLGDPSPREPAAPGPRRPPRARGARPDAGRPCGGIDPATGLLHPCFD
jgi:hypothetical protein